MAKKLIAVTNVKHDGETYEAGSTLDKDLFTHEQLKSLYDNGAVRIEDGPDMPDTSGPNEPEAPAVEAPPSDGPFDASSTGQLTESKPKK